MSQLNIPTLMHTDPIWEHGKIGQLLITRQSDDLFALCNKGKGTWIWAGNCGKCLALGVMHNPCRYCHSKESPCYYQVITYQGHVVQPFYLATCMAKPMDLPTKEHELRNFKYDHPESELEDVMPEMKDISEAEYVIKCPDNNFPPEWLDAAQCATTEQCNRWFHENMLMPGCRCKILSVQDRNSYRSH